MKLSVAFCLLAIALPLAVIAADSEVVDLTAATFDEHIANNDLTLVEFFAPWCGHCKALAPEYEEAAKILKDKHKIAKVDCTTERDLCSTYGIRGFPTIKLFRKDGSQAEYDDARKAEAIARFVLKQAEPAFVVISGDAAVEEFSKKEGGSDIKVLLYTESDSTAAATAFKAASNAHRNDVDFAIVTGNADNKLVLLRNFDAPKVDYTGEFTTEAITAFITEESLPLAGEIGPNNYAKYAERDVPLVWMFLDYNDAAQNAIPEVVAPVAAKHRSKILFVKLDGNRWGDHAKTFSLSGKLPGIVIEDRKTRKNYVFPEDAAVTTDAISNYVESYFKGELVARIRSQEIPENNDGPVTVLVGKTFESIVFDSNKDVFVEFYAPWCGHCKALSPKYDALGEEFKGTDSIVIAKIDSTENDAPADIQGFPTLLFYPANNKANPIPYNGDRSTENMAKFIRENAVTLKSGDAAAAKAKDEL